MVTSVPSGNRLPAESYLITQDLPLLWASLVAFRDMLTPHDTQVRARISRVITALEREQARRQVPGQADTLVRIAATPRLAPVERQAARPAVSPRTGRTRIPVRLVAHEEQAAQGDIG